MATPRKNKKSKKSDTAKVKPHIGRPLKVISEKSVMEMAIIGCTQEEMARCLGCSIDTLQRRFAEVIKRGRAELCRSLRMAQVKMAVMNQNPTMAIWLGKQLLGQKNEPGDTSKGDQIALLIKQMEAHHYRGNPQVTHGSGSGNS